MTLGKTPIIKDGELFIEPNEWFAPIADSYPELEKEYLGLELHKISSDTAKAEALVPIRSSWLRGSDSNRQPTD